MEKSKHDKMLFKELKKYKVIKKFPKKHTREKLSEAFDKLTPKQTYKVNTKIQKKEGKKEYDYISCSEYGRLNEEENLFQFKNLLEWDKKWWEYQKKYTDPKNMETESQMEWWDLQFGRYRELYLQGEWFRWIEKTDFGKKELIYASVEGLYSYMSGSIQRTLDEKIDKKYPNMLFKPYGENTFTKNEDGKYYTMYDYETRAGGKEKELEKIRKKLREASTKINKLILEEIKPYANMTFTKMKFSGKEKMENHLKYMIVGGKEAAEGIKFQTFLKDFYGKEQPYGIIKNLKKRILKKIKKEIIKIK